MKGRTVRVNRSSFDGAGGRPDLFGGACAPHILVGRNIDRGSLRKMPVEIHHRGGSRRIGPPAHTTPGKTPAPSAKARRGAVKEMRGPAKERPEAERSEDERSEPARRETARREPAREAEEAKRERHDGVKRTRGAVKETRGSARKTRSGEGEPPETRRQKHRMRSDEDRSRSASRRRGEADALPALPERTVRANETRGRSAERVRDRYARDERENNTAPPRERDDAAHQAGYGRPPREHRWKPGQSGNPKGRRKGSKNLATIVRELASGKVMIREADGKRRYLTNPEAILHLANNRALKSDPKAMAFMLGLYREFDAGPDAANDMKKPDPADIALLKSYQALQALLDGAEGDE